MEKHVDDDERDICGCAGISSEVNIVGDLSARGETSRSSPRIAYGIPAYA